MFSFSAHSYCIVVVLGREPVLRVGENHAGETSVHAPSVAHGLAEVTLEFEPEPGGAPEGVAAVGGIDPATFLPRWTRVGRFDPETGDFLIRCEEAEGQFVSRLRIVVDADCDGPLVVRGIEPVKMPASNDGE